ncbi:MAG: acetoin utilization protein AcuC, partial [Dehalococcoidia bacterium]
MPKAAFVYNDAMADHVLRQDHPMRPLRLRHTYQLLEAYGAFDQDASQLIRPRPATREELEWLHTGDYVSAVQSLSAGLTTDNPARFGFSQMGDNPIFPGMYDAALLSTGASLVAAELVASR